MLDVDSIDVLVDNLAVVVDDFEVVVEGVEVVRDVRSIRLAEMVLLREVVVVVADVVVGTLETIENGLTASGAIESPCASISSASSSGELSLSITAAWIASRRRRTSQTIASRRME